MPTALTIAGSDSGGGAGIQADLKTFAALEVYGTTAITAITAQNTERVTDVLPLPPRIVTAQIDAVASDIHIDAVKVGMLATADIIEAVADALGRWRLPHVVLDPVMVAKSGDRLLAENAITTLRERLLPLAGVVTPNRLEAEVLAGRPVATLEDAREAARAIAGVTSAAVIVKGGHFPGPRLLNLVFDGTDFVEFVTPRVDARHTHGTGCTFASAVAAHLAHGRSLLDAVDRATQYVAGAVARGLAVGRGCGPVDHFWQAAGRG
jgi:hydroxymethylpyrimidine kinase/phosphomethylpyrimidine kinase